jgi:BlaR1 peptidase M56
MSLQPYVGPEHAAMHLAVDLAVKTTVVLLASALFAAAARKASASLRSAIWAAALLTTLCLPLGILLPGSGSEVVHVGTVDTYRWRSASLAAVCVWISGAAALLLLRIRSVRRLRRVIGRAQQVDHPSVQPSGPKEWRPAFRVLASEEIEVPFAWGVTHPVLVLPAESEEWAPEFRTAVVQHESEHLRRFDPAVALLIDFTTALYWFQPLVWFARRRWLLERERACDDRAVASGMAPHQYAQALLEWSSALTGASPAPDAPSILGWRRQMGHRICALLETQANRNPLGRMPFAVIVAICAVTLFSGRHVIVGLQAGVKGGVTGGINGGVRRGVERAPVRGVTGGVPGGVPGSIQGGVPGGVSGGVAGGVIGPARVRRE